MALFDPNYDFSTLDPSQTNRAATAADTAYNNAVAASNTKKSSSKNVSNKSSGDPQVDALDKQIALYKDAMKEASGYKLKELQQQLEIATADRNERLQAAQTAAEASKYGSDKSLEGTKYSSDNSLKGTQYSSDNSLKGTQYSADTSAASSRYGTDADLYKFNANLPMQRGAQALDFLKNYESMASHPDSFLQASNYGRLGQQTEGMPLMLQDLLGNINPNGSPTGGNIAFRTGTGTMPQNAAMAVFGANPLNLGTRAALPSMPAWNGPQSGSGVTYSAPPGTGFMSQAFNGSGLSSYVPTYGPNDHRDALLSSYGAATAGAMPTMGYRPVDQSYDGSLGAPASAPANAQPMYYALDANGQPRIIAQGGVVPTSDPSEDAFKAGVRDLMARGTQQWGNQALEKMTGTERSLLASGIKDAGGVPEDYLESYARSRIGNSGPGASL